jgi:3-oxoadipate enol-lactonase
MIQPYQLPSGVSLRVSDAGNGTPIVFLHGLGGNLSFWANQAREFSKTRRTLRYDLRGHGDSSPSVRQTLADHAEDLRQLLDELELDRAEVVGLSMGGMIAQYFAATHPERVSALVLTGTVPVFAPPGRDRLNLLADLAETTGMEGVVRNFVGGLFAAETAETDPRYRAIAEAFCGQDARSFAAAARALAEADVTSLLERISAPTFLCYGENDRLTPPKSGQRLADRISGARLTVIPGGGHVLPIENPDGFNQAVAEFLRDQGSGIRERPFPTDW